MENNENLNNQVNEKNNDQSEVVNQTNLVDTSNQQIEKDSQSLMENTPKKSNSGLIALLILIIVGVGGYFAYTKFIAKEEPKGKENPTPSPTVTSTPTPTTEPTGTTTPSSILVSVDKEIYKTEDALYAMKNGYLNKYDMNGKVIKNGSVKIDNDNGIRLSYPSVYKDNIYSLIEVSKKAYLYDFINDKKYEIENPYKIRVCPDLDGFECGMHISMDLAGDKLFIQMPPTDKVEWQPDYEDIVHLFDIKSSKISKVGRYLASDFSLSTEKSNKGYFYIGNDENVFKYDSNGIVVEKSGFNIKNVYKTLDGKYGVSSYFGYDGKLYYLVKEENKIYLQNAFSNDKTEIVDLDKYVLLGVRYYLGKGTYAENTGKIEIILVEKLMDAEKEENEIYYYFDMNNNTITK